MTIRFLMLLLAARAGGLSMGTTERKVTQKWSSACSTPNPDDALVALDEAVSRFELERGADAAKPELAFVYVSAPFEKSFVEIADAAALRIGASLQVCVLGTGVVGGGREHEFEGCVSVTGGGLPEGTLASSFVLGRRSKNKFEDKNDYWETLLPLFSELRQTETSFFVYADPYSAVADAVSFIDESCPGAVVVGGITCPSSQTPSLALHVEGEAKSVEPGSVVGLALRGPRLEMHSVTAQGALPIGPRMRVSSLQQSAVVAGLDGKPAIERLREVVAQAAEEDSMKANSLQSGGILLGVSTALSSERSSRFSDEEDFLVRGLLGVTQEGSLILGDHSIRDGSTLRFHVRDADSAKAEMRDALARYNLERTFFSSNPSGTPFAALLTSCNARGEGLFGERNFDSDTLRKNLGEDLPLAGFFANGEIGPIGAKVPTSSDTAIPTHLHGFTSVVALLYEKQLTDDEEAQLRQQAEAVLPEDDGKR